MQANYDKCLETILHHEGGYVNHPKDPGGETNLGVTKRVYEEFGGTKDMKDLTVEDKEEFFKRAANEIKYSGYIAKQKREVESSKKNEIVLIPSNINYSSIKGLSNEVVEKLIKHKPSTLGQASRLEGVTPAATNLIAITIKKNQLLEKA